MVRSSPLLYLAAASTLMFGTVGAWAAGSLPSLKGSSAPLELVRGGRGGGGGHGGGGGFVGGGDFGYGYGSCYGLQQRALTTGSDYWWSRYQDCVGGY